MNTTFKKTMGATLAAVTLAGSLVAFAPSAEAQWRHHRRGGNGGAVAAGVVGGLALGALAAGAYGAPAYGYPAPAYGAPVYGPAYSDCYFTTQRVWDGYGWVRERVRVCE